MGYYDLWSTMAWMLAFFVTQHYTTYHMTGDQASIKWRPFFWHCNIIRTSSSQLSFHTHRRITTFLHALTDFTVLTETQNMFASLVSWGHNSGTHPWSEMCWAIRHEHGLRRHYWCWCGTIVGDVNWFSPACTWDSGCSSCWHWDSGSPPAMMPMLLM